APGLQQAAERVLEHEDRWLRGFSSRQHSLIAIAAEHSLQRAAGAVCGPRLAEHFQKIQPRFAAEPAAALLHALPVHRLAPVQTASHSRVVIAYAGQHEANGLRGVTRLALQELRRRFTAKRLNSLFAI